MQMRPSFMVGLMERIPAFFIPSKNNVYGAFSGTLINNHREQLQEEGNMKKKRGEEVHTSNFRAQGRQ